MNFIAKILPKAEGILDVQIVKVGTTVITDVKTIKISNAKGMSIVFDSSEGKELLSLQLDDIHRLQHSFSTFLDVVIVETKVETVAKVLSSFHLAENSFIPNSQDERLKFVTVTLDQLDDSDRKHLISFLNSLKTTAEFELIPVEFSDASALLKRIFAN